MADEVARGMSNSEPQGAGSGSWRPSDEDAFWRQNYSSRPYAAADRGYDYYRPAYQYGWESANQYRGRDWNSVESDLRSGWDRARGGGTSTWEQMKDAVRDAWDRMTHAFSHHDGSHESSRTDMGARHDMGEMGERSKER